MKINGFLHQSTIPAANVLQKSSQSRLGWIREYYHDGAQLAFS